MIQYLTHSYLVGSFCVYDSMNADRMGERGGWRRRRLCNILKALRPKEVGKMCTERSFGSTAGLRRIQIPHSDKNDRNTTQIQYSNQKDTITL